MTTQYTSEQLAVVYAICPRLQEIINRHASNGKLARSARRTNYRAEILPLVGAKHLGAALRLYDDTPKPRTPRPVTGGISLISIIFFCAWTCFALAVMGPLWTIIFIIWMPAIHAISRKFDNWLKT